MAFPRAVDTKLSIDTISEISQHEASPVTTTSPRTAFEQQLCTHLLSLSEVVETLADRLMELETRLVAEEASSWKMRRSPRSVMTPVNCSWPAKKRCGCFGIV